MAFSFLFPGRKKNYGTGISNIQVKTQMDLRTQETLAGNSSRLSGIGRDVTELEWRIVCMYR